MNNFIAFVCGVALGVILYTFFVFLAKLPENLELEREYKKRVVSLPSCPNCGGVMLVDQFITYTSLPPQYRKKCINCKYEELSRFEDKV